MSSFLHTDALNHIEKHFDRFPLIKLDRILDRAPSVVSATGRHKTTPWPNCWI